MPWWPKLTGLYRTFWKKQSEDHRLDQELESYVELVTEENIRAGFPPEQARRAARIKLGGKETVKEKVRQRRIGFSLDTFLQDVRYGLRMLRRNKGFALVAVLTLALGIGATTAVFSVVNSVLLNPLPFPSPDRLVMVWFSYPQANLGFDELPIHGQSFLRMQEQVKSFASIFAFKNQTFNLTSRGEAERLDGILVSADFFTVLGVQPSLGRGFLLEEDQPGQNRVMVLSYRLWQRRFNADPDIVGKAIGMNGESYIVIGVAPPGFDFPRGSDMPRNFQFPALPDLWTPLALPAEPRGPSDLAVIARLENGASMEQVQLDLDEHARRMEEAYSIRGAFNKRAVNMQEQIVGDTRPALQTLLGAVAFLLLLACSNTANLILARATGRAREIVVRMALGASRSRLIRQLLTESVLLALLGGAAGTGLAWLAVWWMRNSGPVNLPRLAELQLDLRVLLLTGLVSILCGLVFGLAPARSTTAADLRQTLNEMGRRNTATGSRKRHSRAFIVSQVALSLILLIGAGLMVRSFIHMLDVNPGFRKSGTFTFELTLPESKYNDRRKITQFFQHALAQINALPDVKSAAVGKPFPMSGAQEASVFAVENLPVPPLDQTPVAEYTITSPGYFHSLGIPLLQGRGFEESDTADSPRVLVVSREFARRYWPGKNALGKRIKLGTNPADNARPWMTIVGVAEDVKRFSLTDKTKIEMYVPYTQDPYPSLSTMQIAVQTERSVQQLIPLIREEIKKIDPLVPLARIRTMEELLSRSVSKFRFTVLLLTSFSTLAILLAAVGLYGVISHLVNQRTQEIGIRMALGAQPGTILTMVLRHGLGMTVVGIAIGCIGAFGLTYSMSSLLFGVSPIDPLTYTGVSGLLLMVGLLACYLPARRAAKVDPMVALRYE